MVNCSNCGFDAGESNFCPNCGSKIIIDKSNSFCPTCGADVDGSIFCPNCGTKIQSPNKKASSGSSQNEKNANKKDFIENVADLDDKLSRKVEGLFSKSKSMNKVLDKTASYRYKNMSKSANNSMDRKYYEKIEPVFLEVLDSIDDVYVKDILLYQRSIMGSGGNVVGLVAAQVYTPTKDMSYEEGKVFYQNMANDIIREINEEKQRGTFDEEEFYKKKIKQNTLNNVSVLGIPKSIKSFKNNQK